MFTRQLLSKKRSTIEWCLTKAVVESLEDRCFLSGSTVYVDQSATGNQSGMDWADAFTHLQSALAAAAADSPSASNFVAIEVAEGTYVPGTEATDTFQLVGNTSIKGGYAPGGSAMPNPSECPTILSGGGFNSTVLTSGPTASGASLNGLTISGSSGVNAFGGGLLVSYGNVTVNDCTFSDNTALCGGGIYIDANSSATITNCAFRTVNPAFIRPIQSPATS